MENIDKIIEDDEGQENGVVAVENDKPVEKKKKPRSEAQKLAWEKCLAKRKAMCKVAINAKNEEKEKIKKAKEKALAEWHEEDQKKEEKVEKKQLPTIEEQLEEDDEPSDFADDEITDEQEESEEEQEESESEEEEIVYKKKPVKKKPVKKPKKPVKKPKKKKKLYIYHLLRMRMRILLKRVKVKMNQRWNELEKLKKLKNQKKNLKIRLKAWILGPK